MTTPGYQASSGHMFVPVNYAALTVTQRANYKEMEKALITAITEDPEVEHPTNVSVFATEDGGKPAVHLIGKVQDDRERKRVEEIAVKNLPEDVKVVNEIVVD